MIKKPRDKISRRSVCAMSVGTLAGMAISPFSAAGPLEHLFQSKDHYTGPVAKKLAEFKEEFYPAALAFNGDGSQLAVNFMVSNDGVHIWNWSDPKHIPRKLDYPGSADDGRALSYSPDGRLLAVRHGITLDGRVIRVWNAQTLELVHDVVAQDAIGSSWGSGGAADFVFSPDGRFLVLAIDRDDKDPRNKVLVFQTNTWELAWGLPTSPFLFSVVAFSPDGKILALSGYVGAMLGNGSSAQKILLFDIATRQIVLTIDAPIAPHKLAWSPDGLHIAVISNTGYQTHDSEVLQIFEAATGKKVAGVSARSGIGDGLAYTPDGRYLIVGSVDDSVRIMDGHTYTLLQRIPGDLRSVAVSRDSRYLAISGYPKISVWELKQ